MNRQELQEFICDCFWFVVLVIFAIWLYFAMVANAPEETPETPKEQRASVKLYWNEFNDNYIIKIDNNNYLIDFEEVESINEFEDLETLDEKTRNLIVF